MRKVLFCLSLIISLSVLGVVPSFASTVAIDPALIGNLGDLGYSLAGGGSYSFDDSYIQKKYFSEYESADSFMKRKVAEKAAEDFLTQYAISRNLPLPSNASDYVENLPTDTYSYFKSVYFDNQVRSITNNAKLAGDDSALLTDALRFGIGPSAFATWAEYSQFWYNKFTAIGESDSSDSDVVVDHPAEYDTFIDYMNKQDSTIYQSFWFYDLPASTTINSFSCINRCVPLSDYSWVVVNQANANVKTFGDSVNYHQTPCIMPLNIHSLYITSNGDNTYSFTDTFQSELGNILSTNGSNTSSNYLIAYPSYYSNLSNYAGLQSTKTYSKTNASLTQIFNYLILYYKNVNIYVDGELWGKAGSIDDAPANPIIPEFPDVIDPTSDDPAYTIDLPATDTGEGYFDITSLFDALVDAIEGALDDDITTDGVLDGTRGLEYEDEAGEAVNDDPIPDDDVIDDSIPDPTGMPNIPVPLPPIQDAFSGTTVLAELVHATDVVMPDELMAVFWGILFILFIIGLIKVLHK